ncbi:hypothetical protein SAMN05444358_10325 [Ruegeria halocynthiae]|uniref:SMODS and SLOG-associating 2TM effector domain-containing protein n=1 Tax=Ruegeria halocynthiae TaxID=985054 RepID=A0A1H2YYB8_9RHOB|nr:hypothetical protein [Ruegeria halocynthiae]SDX10077.1 hypothetical protein SAMN05444358_10325 [Ruegeria halocynthiae]
MKTKSVAQKLWNKTLRPTLYVTTQLLFFGGYSAYFLRANEPEKFAKFGAVIIAWAVLNIAFQRNRYSTALESWERSWAEWQYNHTAKAMEFRDRAITNTFNVHASQIAQINHKMGYENPFVENTPEAIREFAESVQIDQETADSFRQEQENFNEQFLEFQNRYKYSTRFQGDWSSLMWRLELLLVAVGTIQTAYGADFVIWFHNTF